jgi:molybdenum cofactor biosynthesis protein MoaC
MHSLEQNTGGYFMADIRRKRPTARRAVAVGEFYAGDALLAQIVARQLPKGDALLLAEMAGIQGVKLAPSLMPLCHPLPIELVRVRCVPIFERGVVGVYCEVATEARTGVEMEALAGVNSALLTLYDLSKPVQPALSFGGVRLLFKEGGKKGLWLHPDGMTEDETTHYRPQQLPQLTGISCAVLTLSDRAAAGSYADKSGPALVKCLQDLGAESIHTEVLPDDADQLLSALQSLCADTIELILCTGGTGLGPRDITPETLQKLGGREIPGLAELCRSQGQHHTPMAWLSRLTAVQIGNSLIIALPGSTRAVQQNFDILAPILAHALAMIAGKDHA